MFWRMRRCAGRLLLGRGQPYQRLHSVVDTLPLPPPVPPKCRHRPLPLLSQAGTVQLQPRKPQGFAQTLPAAADEAIKVSLHDCLACSGCVTSAEAVLLQHQSAGELLQRLADPDWTVVVSLSPQSIAALAAVHRLSSAECAARLTAFLRHLGVAAVFDIAAARQVALAEAAREFLQRYRSSRGGSTAEAAAAAGQDAAGGGDDMDVDRPKPSSDGHRNAVGGGSPGPLPMLASACPGWVCYAEKTHGDHVLPYIATGQRLVCVQQLACAAAGRPLPSTPTASTAPCVFTTSKPTFCAFVSQARARRQCWGR